MLIRGGLGKKGGKGNVWGNNAREDTVTRWWLGSGLGADSDNRDRKNQWTWQSRWVKKLSDGSQGRINRGW
jgi:hypothetical protein